MDKIVIKQIFSELYPVLMILEKKNFYTTLSALGAAGYHFQIRHKIWKNCNFTEGMLLSYFIHLKTPLRIQMMVNNGENKLY